MSNSSSSSYAWGLTVLRVVVGVVFLMHGGQKLFVYGFHGVAGLFTSLGIPLPAISAVVVTLVEFVGGACLILGVATRLAAALLAFDMLVAIFVVHLKNGFFDQTRGFEFPLSLLAASVCLALSGPGAASIGSLFAKKGV
jgi:putative oxidoreductase